MTTGGSEFASVYAEHYGYVCSVVARMTRRLDPEDVAQEVFICVLRKLADFRGEASMRSWLHRITVNKVLEMLRRKRISTVEIDEARSISGGWFTSADELMVRDAMNRLPERAREILFLYHAEGYSVPELGRALGIGESAVRGRLRAARLRMRQALGG